MSIARRNIASVNGSLEYFNSSVDHVAFLFELKVTSRAQKLHIIQVNISSPAFLEKKHTPTNYTLEIPYFPFLWSFLLINYCFSFSILFLTISWSILSFLIRSSVIEESLLDAIWFPENSISMPPYFYLNFIRDWLDNVSNFTGGLSLE